MQKHHENLKLPSVRKSDFPIVLKNAQFNGLLSNEDSAAIFIDYQVVENTIGIVKSAFPTNVFHALAIKSNPLIGLLKEIANKKQMGAECASFEELMIAKHAGFSYNQIVFDSPAKTKQEIKYISENCPELYVNADNLEELKRYPVNHSLKLGLRINPQLELNNALSYLSVSGRNSKFGEPISNRTQIINNCIQFNVNGLHVHVASQVSNWDSTLKGIEKVYKLAEEINKTYNNQITHIDIGGGFPVNYKSENQLNINEFANQLYKVCPHLNKYKVITEFGRFIQAKAGWAISRIEYLKQFENQSVLINHLGADMFLREAYNPNDWFHKLFVISAEGELLENEELNVDIAGPLCFGGDYLQKNGKLDARIKPGDWLVISDVGANTFSLWSRHCSRVFPKVILYNNQNMSIIKKRETIKDIINFWS